MTIRSDEAQKIMAHLVREYFHKSFQVIAQFFLDEDGSSKIELCLTKDAERE
jgi:hypothetical protein